jgi:hypothetical protein
VFSLAPSISSVGTPNQLGTTAWPRLAFCGPDSSSFWATPPVIPSRSYAPPRTPLRLGRIPEKRTRSSVTSLVLSLPDDHLKSLRFPAPKSSATSTPYLTADDRECSAVSSDPYVAASERTPTKSIYSAESATSEPLSLTQEAATAKLPRSETDVPPSNIGSAYKRRPRRRSSRPSSSRVSIPSVSKSFVGSYQGTPTPSIVGSIPDAVSEMSVTSGTLSSESNVALTQPRTTSIAGRSPTASPIRTPRRPAGHRPKSTTLTSVSSHCHYRICVMALPLPTASSRSLSTCGNFYASAYILPHAAGSSTKLYPQHSSEDILRGSLCTQLAAVDES